MPASDFHFFADMMEKPVLDRTGRTIGYVLDLHLTSDPYPHVTELVVRAGLLRRSYAVIPASKVDRMLLTVHLELHRNDIEFKHQRPTHDFCLVRDILDQQVVDTDGQKVIRVNDVQLLSIDRELRVSAVDISMRGLIRRLGWQWWADRFVELFLSRTDYFKENLINWRYVQPLAINPQKGTLRLTINQHQLSQIPHADFSDIMQNMDLYKRMALFQSISTDFRPKVFSDLDLTMQKELLENLDLKEAAGLLAKIPADQTADLLEEVPKAVADSLLALMETTQARRLSTLLGYTSDSAGGLMTTEMIVVPHTAQVSDAFNRVRELQDHLENFYHVYLVEQDNRLMGQVLLKRLLLAPPHAQLTQFAFPKPLFVRAKDSLREVAYLMEKYRLPAIPVVNNGKERILQGVITIDDILAKLIPIAWRRRAKVVS